MYVPTNLAHLKRTGTFHCRSLKSAAKNKKKDNLTKRLWYFWVRSNSTEQTKIVKLGCLVLWQNVTFVQYVICAFWVPQNPATLWRGTDMRARIHSNTKRHNKNRNTSPSIGTYKNQYVRVYVHACVRAKKRLLTMRYYKISLTERHGLPAKKKKKERKKEAEIV